MKIEKLYAFYAKSSMCGTVCIYAGTSFNEVATSGDMFIKEVERDENENFERLRKLNDTSDLIIYNSDDEYSDYILYEDNQDFYLLDKDNYILYRLVIIMKFDERY